MIAFQIATLVCSVFGLLLCLSEMGRNPRGLNEVGTILLFASLFGFIWSVASLLLI